MKLLLVEDNLDYAKPAIEVLGKAYDVTHRTDFVTAQAAVGENSFDAAVSDCFFPYETGSQNRQPGIDLVTELRAGDDVERGVLRDLKLAGNVLDLSDSRTREFARGLSMRQSNGISQSPLYRAIQATFGEQKITLSKMDEILFSTAGYDELSALDYYGDMLKAIDADEANQPLGISMGTLLGNNGIPFVLATSTYHHDTLTQKIQNYAAKKQWALIDCAKNSEATKATPEYWNNVKYSLGKKL